jgi:Cof subfamily protein (haloacid dehalogenase superfamily)
LGLAGPIIAYNGALVRTGTETLYHCPLDREAALDLLAIARKRSVFSLAFVDDRVYSECAEHAQNQYYHRHSGVEVETVDDLDRIVAHEEPTKLLFISTGTELEGLEAGLRGSRLASRCRIMRSMSDMVEVTDAEADKGEALSLLVERLEIDPSRVAAIGDAENDLGMLGSVPLSIAMGNASNRVKSISRYETLNNNQDGVAVALRRFTLGDHA